MLATAIFDHLFYKKQYLSNGLSWNFTPTLQINGFSWYKEKYSLTLSIHKVILTCLGAVFSGHGVYTSLAEYRPYSVESTPKFLTVTSRKLLVLFFCSQSAVNIHSAVYNMLQHCSSPLSSSNDATFGIRPWRHRLNLTVTEGQCRVVEATFIQADYRSSQTYHRSRSWRKDWRL